MKNERMYNELIELLTTDSAAGKENAIADKLTEKMEALGFTVLPSQANFIFAKSDKIPGGDLYRKLKENGILVRWFDADRIRDYVRITIGALEQMAALVDEIARLLEEL